MTSSTITGRERVGGPKLQGPGQTAFYRLRGIRHVTPLPQFQTRHRPLIGCSRRAELRPGSFKQHDERVRQEKSPQPGHQDSPQPQPERYPAISSSGDSRPTVRKVMSIAVLAGPPGRPAWRPTPWAHFNHWRCHPLPGHSFSPSQASSQLATGTPHQGRILCRGVASHYMLASLVPGQCSPVAGLITQRPQRPGGRS